MRVLKVLDRRSDRRLELDHRLPRVRSLVVDDNLKVHSVVVHHTLHSPEVDPQVVRVEDLELAHRLEVLDVVRGDLCDLEETYLTLVVDEGAAFDIRLGLVRHLHQELGLGRVHVLENVEVHHRAEVVDVGHKEVLLARREELVDQTRVGDRVVQVAVARRVPAACEPRPGRKRATYHDPLSSSAERGVGSELSRFTRGNRDWLNVMSSMLWLAYFWMMRAVS